MLFLVVYALIADKLNDCSKEQLCENMPMQFNADLHFSLHSHLDAFWLQTYTQYQKGIGTDRIHKGVCTECIFNGVIDSLIKLPQTTYIVAEMCFFKPWYEQYPNKTAVQELVATGRLDIVNGGWVQNDQACANYQDIILQMAVGHQWIYDTFNITPQVGFNIDAFGHSSAQSSIHSLMGMNSQIIERLDVNDIFSRVKNHTLEFEWMSGPYNHKVMTHARFRRHGPSTHHGAVFAQLKASGDGFCFQVYSQLKEFEQTVQFQKQGGITDLTFHYGGDDFQYFNETTYEAQNLLVDFYNTFRCRQLRVQWSGPTKFFQALNDKKGIDKTQKYGDFFPYYEDGLYWTAYYTTNPGFKIFVRQASLQLQFISMYVAQNQIQVPLQQLREEIALAQHHDGISGTSKYFVHDDVIKRIQSALDIVRQRMVQPNQLDLVGQLSRRQQAHKRIIVDCTLNSKCVQEYLLKNRRSESLIVLVYNHQHAQNKIIEIDLPSPTVQILTSKGNTLEQEVRCWKDSCKLIFKTFMNGYCEEQFILSFQCDNLCATITTFKQKLDLTLAIQDLEKQFEEGLPIDTMHWNETLYDDVTLYIDREGIDYQFRFSYLDNNFTLAFNFYPNLRQSSFNYWQKRPFVAQAGKYVMLNDFENGGLICVFEKLHILEQSTKFKEVILECGKVYQVTLAFRPQGVEVKTQLNSQGLQQGDYTMQIVLDNMKNSSLFTDANGWHMMYRENYKRENYEPMYNQSDQINGNVYPITAYALLQSENATNTMALLTDRAQGVFSLHPSTLEIVLEHYGQDDGQGVGESCSKKVNNEYRHFIAFNTKCVRCLWNEWQGDNQIVRLTDQYVENAYDIVAGDRSIRLELWPMSVNRFVLIAENMQEVLPELSQQQYKNYVHNPSLDKQVDMQLVEAIIQREFKIQSAYLSGVPVDKLVDLNLKAMEIKAYILLINEQYDNIEYINLDDKARENKQKNKHNGDRRRGKPQRRDNNDRNNQFNRNTNRNRNYNNDNDNNNNRNRRNYNDEDNEYRNDNNNNFRNRNNNGNFNRNRNSDGPWNHDLYHQYDSQSAKLNRGTVEISNLHYSVTSKELKELAEQYGNIKNIQIDWDDMGRSKETARIEYVNENDARKAADKLNGLQIESVPLNAKLYEPQIRRRGYFKK